MHAYNFAKHVKEEVIVRYLVYKINVKSTTIFGDVPWYVADIPWCVADEPWCVADVTRCVAPYFLIQSCNILRYVCLKVCSIISLDYLVF